MIYIAADHAGYKLKEFLLEKLTERNIIFEDFGTFHPEKEDSYVSYARQVVRAIQKKKGWGILICGSGVGMSITANRTKNIRAALVWNSEVAKRAREEDDANIACLPARLISDAEAWNILLTFLSTTFSGDDRYVRRLEQLER